MSANSQPSQLLWELSGTHERKGQSGQTAAKEMMAKQLFRRAFTVALTLALSGVATSQMRPSGPEGAAPTKVSTEVLKGTWVRPDGGYRIVIQGVGGDGKIEAMYFNPMRLPFAKAQVSQDGATFRVALELQAGGYGGSTYDLLYEPATDRLKGTYYQAVAKQRFDVYFERR
jgi:hypothetical protein